MKLPSPSLSRMSIECGVIKGLFALESHKVFIEMNSGPHYKISKSDIFRHGASESSFEPTSPHKNHHCIWNFTSNIFIWEFLEKFFILVPENQQSFWLYSSDTCIINQLYLSICIKTATQHKCWKCRQIQRHNIILSGYFSLSLFSASWCISNLVLTVSLFHFLFWFCENLELSNFRSRK